MLLILVNIDTGLDTPFSEFYELQVCRELESHSGQIIKSSHSFVSQCLQFWQTLIQD